MFIFRGRGRAKALELLVGSGGTIGSGGAEPGSVRAAAL